MEGNDVRAAMESVGDRFDLGEYEIDAYLTVLEHGELTASEIADRTDIPQPRVYDTVRSLNDRGLVELRESRPMKALAVDPEDAFADVESSIERMIEELTARYSAPARETEAVALVKSRSTILRYIEEVVETAEYELTLSLTPDLLERFEDDLATAIDRGVSVHLVLTPAAKAPDPAGYDYSTVATTARARRGITTPVVAVADGEYSIYATQDALRDDQDRYGVIFNRSALGFLVSAFFGTVIWTTADRELYLDRAPPEFPRTYASIRRCVRDLAAAEGDEFYAAIDGRDVETGTTRTISGRIVDTQFEESGEVAGLTVAEDGEEYAVGGLVAAYEDVEAHEISVARDAPPEA